ncbi:MAG: hypothetical protein U1F58_03410 [Burkholderiales bacterium]
MGTLWRGTVAAAALAGSLVAAASPLTVAECFEGGDFIANAARARDNGVRRDVFLARLEEDLMLIQAYPPALRWFAKDADDEELLSHAARDVFDAPAAPEAHRARFLAVCFTRASA